MMTTMVTATVRTAIRITLMLITTMQLDQIMAILLPLEMATTMVTTMITMNMMLVAKAIPMAQVLVTHNAINNKEKQSYNSGQ